VYGINQSDAKYVVTTEDLLVKLDKLSDKLSNVEKVVYIRNGKAANHQEFVDKLAEKKLNVSSFEQIVENGNQIAPCEFPVPDPDSIAIIMYTSGTTGDPKGVIMRHRNLMSSIQNLMRMDEEIGNLAFGSQFAFMLPLTHVFGALLATSQFVSGSKIAFCSPFTLLDSSPAHVKGQVGDMRLIQPEFFIAVPLVLERILKEIYRQLSQKSPLAAPLFTYLMVINRLYNVNNTY